MPHELEYIVDKAVMLCDEGAKPNYFRSTMNPNVKINGCKVSIATDKAPLINLPEFGVCAKTGSPCTPVPTAWTDTYKVKVKGQQTLLYKSKMPCGKGGKMEFVTSGQVPVTQAQLDEMMNQHGESQEEEDDGWGFWDTVELIPVVGSITGMVREGAKGNWGMVALNAGFLVMDVAGLVSFGATTAASTAAKTAVKVGVKAAAKSAAKKTAGKIIAKAGAKVLSKKGAKALAKSLAKKVDDFAIKNGKICVFACFPEGTPVHTAEGIKPIEDIRQGDLVWAKDEETGAIALKQVTTTLQREVDATVEISLEGETIETTAEHPFYTKSGWKDAADLSPEDHVQTKHNEWHSVKGQNFLYQKKKVYNFEVADWHTYFVGALAWLVHNAKVCVKGAIKKVSKRLKYLGRTPGKKSRTGREVFERMQKEGTARVGRGGKKEFWDPSSNKWRDISQADMGHIEDAVSWWNKTGRKYGPKSKEVRDWMLDSKNYVYEYYKTNRSKGAKLLENYLDPF